MCVVLLTKSNDDKQSYFVFICHISSVHIYTVVPCVEVVTVPFLNTLTEHFTQRCKVINCDDKINNHHNVSEQMSA